MSEPSAEPEWKQLEVLVAAIQKELSPNATVSHNVKLPGLQSETNRQIDVLVEQYIGQYAIKVVIDCKDYASPVDVKAVEEFHGLVQDVGAHKGALVCPSGFTKSAKKRARKLQIDLYSPADTGSHKWKVNLSLPTLCDFRSTGMAFGISCSTPLPFTIREAIQNLMVHDEADKPIGAFLEIASDEWDNGEFPSDPGEHDRVPIMGGRITKVDNGHGTLVPVKLTVSLNVTQQLYIGHLPIEKLRGLKDEQTGVVVANAFTLGGIDPIHVQNEWVKVKADEELPFHPVMQVIGLHCWGVKG